MVEELFNDASKLFGLFQHGQVAALSQGDRLGMEPAGLHGSVLSTLTAWLRPTVGLGAVRDIDPLLVCP